MINLAIWDKQEGFALPNGLECTVEDIYHMYPFTKQGIVVLEYLPNGFVGAIDDLAILRSTFDIDPALSDTEAVAEIKRLRELPPEPVVDPVEAKLDYLVMMS